jgi:hypothetical protein
MQDLGGRKITTRNEVHCKMARTVQTAETLLIIQFKGCLLSKMAQITIPAPAVSYSEIETSSLILKDEHELQTLVNEVSKKAFGPKSATVSENWKVTMTWSYSCDERGIKSKH